MRLPTLNETLRRLRHLRARWAARWAPCPICHGSERELVDFGHGDVRDLPCSMCNGLGTYRAYEQQRAEFYAKWEADGDRAA